MHERLRHLLLGRTAQFVSDHPRWTLLVAALITVAAIALTVDRLEFQADRNALVSADLDWNQRYLQYLEMFRGNDDLVVIVRVPNEEDGRARAEQYVVQLEQRLLSQPDHIESVYARIDRTQVSPRALRLLPPDQFEQNMARMEQQAPILQWPTIGGFLTAVAARAAPDATTDSLAPMGRMLDRLNVGFATGAINDDLFSPLTSPNGDDWQYLSTKDDPESDEDELLLMIVAPNPVIGQLDAYADVAQTIRAAIARTSEQMPGIESGLTGVPVIEADETDVSMRDSMKCSILAVLLIATLLIIAFHSFRWPLLAVTALLIGVAWSFGFLTLAIGHLQILSVVFTIILLGLGIDFGIHLISRFELVRHRYPDGTVGFAPAMVDTMQTVGPGIITGAVTTALAFGTTLLTSFRGMAEMGLIAGVGILLCLIAMGTVFPALMRTFRKKWKHVMPMDQRPVDLFPVERLMPLVRHPGWVIISAVVVIGAAAVGISQLRYNYNLESLLPHGVDSVKWQKVYRQHSRQSVWFGASICRNLDEAKYRAAAFRALSTVDSVQGVGLLFPEDEPAKLQRMAHARAAIGSALTDPPAESTPPHDAFADFANQIARYQLMLSFAAVQPLPTDDRSTRPPLAALAGQLTLLNSTLTTLDPTVGQSRLDQINSVYRTWRTQMQRMIHVALDPASLQFSDLPEIARRNIVATDDDGQTSYLLKVYPKGNVYEPKQLEPFVEQMRSVDAELGNAQHPVTGTIVQIYESSRLIRESYMLAGLFALLAVLILVYFDFQYLIDALLCLVPVCAAFVTLLGLMGGIAWWLGPDNPSSYLFMLNPANIIVLPLLFGIGVDAGVHMIHRYRVSPRARPPGLTSGTGKGIILTSLTTIIGFSAMMLASHRGIASLGFVLTAGTTLTLLACLTVMPAVLVWRWRLRGQYPGIFRPRRSVQRRRQNP